MFNPGAQIQPCRVQIQHYNCVVDGQGHEHYYRNDGNGVADPVSGILVLGVLALYAKRKAITKALDSKMLAPYMTKGVV